MQTRFLVVPQWQGSGSSRAMRLIDGAEAIAGDLPAAATTRVDVPLEAGECLDTGVHRYSAIVATRDRVRAALTELGAIDPQAAIVTVGGDCGVELAPVQHALGRHPGAAVVWFDAHPDLNSVDSSPSGAFHGMVLRTLLGDGPDELTAGAEPLSASRVVLAATRSLDDAETRFVADAGIALVSPDELSDPQPLVRAVEATGADAVYLHIDLDVLDPAAIAGIGFPEPFGLSPEALCDAVRALRSRFTLAGASITEFAPESLAAAEHDLPVILRVLGALTARTAGTA